MATVSVVCCAFTMKRWDQILLCLEGIGSQTRKPDEIILVSDHADDVYNAFVETNVGEVYENRLRQGVAGARNTGWQAAKGDIVAFLDDDAHPEEHWLEKLVAPIEENPHVAAAGGWIEPTGDNVPAWYPKEFYWVFGCSWAGLAGRKTLRNPIGASMAWRRSTLETVGGFTTEIGRSWESPLSADTGVAAEATTDRQFAGLYGCEETIAGMQARAAGNIIFHAEDSVAYHYVGTERACLRYLMKRCWGEGMSKEFAQYISGQRLADESRHVFRILWSLGRYSVRRGGWRSVEFSVVGLCWTTAGFLYGRACRIRGARGYPARAVWTVPGR